MHISVGNNINMNACTGININISFNARAIYIISIGIRINMNTGIAPFLDWIQGDHELTWLVGPRHGASDHPAAFGRGAR